MATEIYLTFASLKHSYLTYLALIFQINIKKVIIFKIITFLFHDI